MRRLACLLALAGVAAGLAGAATPPPLLVRADLAAPKGGRDATRVSLLALGQLTDVHLVDEESPARLEYVDSFGGAVSSAYRPQEGLEPFVLESMVRRLRETTGPLGGRRLDLVLETGDGVDTPQRNLVDLLAAILDGGREVNPDSGAPGSCGTPAGSLYDGVRGGAYYDPDSAADTTYAGLPDFPGLFEAMNRPFRATGLGVRWLAVAGNHDELVQGVVPLAPAVAAIATGCTKVTGIAPETLGKLLRLAGGGLTPAEQQQAERLIVADAVAVANAPAAHPGLSRRVASDPARAMLRPAALAARLRHGLPARAPAYYATSPVPRVRLVVLDTASETERGNVDDAQFRWLDAELRRDEAARRLVVVTGHHTLESMDEAGRGLHVGLGPCKRRPEPLACLFLRHRGVVAYVAGHEHRNRVRPFRRAGGGGFWEVATAALIDWPQQARVIELLDNRDGTLSLATATLDHAAPARPEDASDETLRLASIARVLARADPQVDVSRAGTPRDRDVELLLPDPYR